MGPPARKRMAVEAVTPTASSSSSSSTTSVGGGSSSATTNPTAVTSTTQRMTNPNNGNSNTSFHSSTNNNNVNSNNHKSSILAILQNQQQIYNNNTTTNSGSSNTIQRWKRTVQFAQELNQFCTTTTNFTGTTISQLTPIPIRNIHDKNNNHIETLSQNNNNNNTDSTTTTTNTEYDCYEPYIIELQLSICRKLRELLLLGIVTASTSLLPNNMYLCYCTLHTIQYYQWIPLLLAWQQPPPSIDGVTTTTTTGKTTTTSPSIAAVQIEALLAVTSIAELLCTTETPSNMGSLCHGATSASNTANAISSSSGSSSSNGMDHPTSSSHPHRKLGNHNNNNSNRKSTSVHHYQNCILAATVGNTNQHHMSHRNYNNDGNIGHSSNNNTNIQPFPPLSFHQSSIYMTNNNSNGRSSQQQYYNNNNIEAYIEFDASIVQVVQENKNCFIIPTPVQFHDGGDEASRDSLSSTSTGTTGMTTTIIPQPPVTASSNHTTTTSIFPQPLSIKAQNIFLRHREAIPTLISLLSSPSQQVYEQSVLILGSIAAGDACPPPPPPASLLHHHNPIVPLGLLNDSINNSTSSSNNNNNNNSIFPPLNDGTGSGRNNSNGGAGSSNIINDNNNNGKNGNNSGAVPSARDFLLASGVMNPLLRCLESHPTNLSLQRIGSWTISTLLDNIFQQPASASATMNGTGNMNGGGSALTNPGSSSDRASVVTSLLNNAVSSTVPSSANGPLPPNMSLPFGKNGNNMMAGTNNMNGEYTSADAIDMDQLLPVLYRLLHMTDSEVLSYICWSLSYLCDGPASHIAAVVTTPPDKLSSKKQPPGGLVPRLVELLVHPSWRVTKPALRTIGNIVCAECPDDGNGSGSTNVVTTDYTEVILDCNAVPRLKELITHSNREIQKEAAWTLSNIAAGTVDQIQAVIDSGAIPPLVNLVKDTNTDQEVRSEACWVVLNATSCGCDSQIELLVDEGCVSVLGVLLSEASMVMMALEGLERVLQVEEAREMIRRERIENGEIEDNESNRTPVLVSASLIETARDGHNSSQVTKKAEKVWKHHFVYCALCRESFSRHRISDVSFCEECKCHVCKSCNCQIYHLDYQEELWAATEEQTEAKKNAKKSKNKKKKAKLKEKKASTKVTPDESMVTQSTSHKSSQPPALMQLDDDEADDDAAVVPTGSQQQQQHPELPPTMKISTQSSSVVNVDQVKHVNDDDDDDSQNYHHPQIDLVLYLQQTGSIIALSKLMDALEYGGEDYDDELDEYERKMIQEQQLMRGQATN